MHACKSVRNQGVAMARRFDHSLTDGMLYTDEYQLTMAQLYFRLGLHEQNVQFDHFFRSYPDYGGHKAGYCINAGLEWFLDWMLNTRFEERDIEMLKSQTGSGGKPLFADDFLDWLRRNGDFTCLSMQAIPEGRVVHPLVPLTVVTGPLAMAQILETALLNMLNYHTLIATKACRIRQLCKEQLVLEFGIRRAHDRGAVAGARAALIGGADFTSFVGISHMLGYPPKGTHAHSMVQLFMSLGKSELDSFRAFAELYPDDCILLVDTIDTLGSGVPNAIKVFEELRRKGHQPLGIRLDSGDLAYLSIRAAAMLDKAGFSDVKIVLSNELDEMNIWQILAQVRDEAPKAGIDPDTLIRRFMYGVGTRLITSAGDSSLGGVYKLVGVEREGRWVPAIKLSDSVEKIPLPGKKEAVRLYDDRSMATADLICLADEKYRERGTITLHHPLDEKKRRILNKDCCPSEEPLLVSILEEGTLVYQLPELEDIRMMRDRDMERLDSGVRRLIVPHRYHVSLSEKLWKLKQDLINGNYENSQDT
jgi:nicotinate phosphoribosyltransferase